MSIDGKWIRKNETREFKFDERKQENQEYDEKKSRFDEIVKNGMDRVMAYQIIYNISNDEAKEIVARENYKNLINCGLPEEMARKLVYKTEESNSKMR